MKKITLSTFLLIILFSFISCGVKQTQNLLSSGNYDEAINKSISNIGSNKDKKGKQDYIYLLEEAFAKAKERDLNTISLLVKQANPADLEKLYNLYLQLNDRQEKIKPLLPLKLKEENRNAIFQFENYNEPITSSKNALSNYLYSNAKALILTNTKINYRRAFDDLTYLNSINSNYKDVLKITEDARLKGLDFVIVNSKNETNTIIPVRLQNDLLDFNTYGLNDKWTVYNTAKQKGVKYDYAMTILFRDILISPEQIKEREFIKERQIKDGQKRLLDANGKEVLDNTGKVIMVDNLINAHISIYEIKQFKSCQVTAKVEYIDLINNQSIDTFPLTSEFVFENIYSTYKGDRRAADDNYFFYFDKRVVPFPSSDQMVYDTGENLKSRLKDILNRNKFRK
jgi:hypothetical protein